MSKIKPIPEKTYAVFQAIQEVGGNITTKDLAEMLGKSIQQITPSINYLAAGNKGNGRFFVERREEFVEGEDGKDVRVVYVDLTDAGRAFVQPSGDEE